MITPVAIAIPVVMVVKEGINGEKEKNTEDFL